MTKSRLSIEKRDDTYMLTGVIDELSDFSELLKATDGSVKLDLQGIQRINSYGIKNWILMLNKLQEKNITFINCPVCFIEQINLVPGIQGRAKVDSFFLPFFCPECEEEYSVKVSFEESKKDGFVDELDDKYNCKECDSKMEFYDDVELYFDFLQE